MIKEKIVWTFDYPAQLFHRAKPEHLPFFHELIKTADGASGFWHFWDLECRLTVEDRMVTFEVTEKQNLCEVKASLPSPDEWGDDSPDLFEIKDGKPFKMVIIDDLLEPGEERPEIQRRGGSPGRGPWKTEWHFRELDQIEKSCHPVFWPVLEWFVFKAKRRCEGSVRAKLVLAEGWIRLIVPKQKGVESRILIEDTLPHEFYLPWSENGDFWQHYESEEE